VLGILKFVRQQARARELEQLKADLAGKAAARQAKLEYEYKARLRLYESLGPSLFQLLELADYALNRIKNLTNPAVWAELAQGEENPPSPSGRPPMAEGKYEMVSTLYGLFAPLVVIRCMSRRLTMLDLSLEPLIGFQYHLASRIYGSFKDDRVLWCHK
jgi:hypothetical protein